MVFSFRYTVLLICFTLLVGCKPYQYDIKNSYRQVSKNITQTVSALGEKINSVGSKIVRKNNNSRINSIQDQYKKIDNVENLLAKKDNAQTKNLYNQDMPFQKILWDVISNHPEVLAAQYLEKAAEQEVSASKGNTKPQITGSLNAGGVRENLSSSEITSGVGLNAGISQLIYDGGQTTSGIGKKEALFEKAKANNTLVKGRVGFEASNAWIDLWNLNEKLKEIKRTNEHASPILADIKRIAENGLIDRTIVDNVEHSLLKISMNQQKLEMDIEIAKLRFSNFYGEIPDNVIEPKSPFSLKILENKMKDKKSIPSLRLAAAELIASRQEVNSILGEFKPKVSFNLAANSPLDTDEDASLAVGIQSTYTFSDGGALKARLKVAEAKSSEMEFNLENTKIQTTRSVESDFQLLAYLLQSRALTQKRLQKNSQSLNVLKSQILTGQSKLNNLIDVHIERIGIVNNLLDNTAQYEKAKYSLASVLGEYSDLEAYF